MKIFIIILLLVNLTSCSKQVNQETSGGTEQNLVTTTTNSNIGLRLHTMIEWTDDANSFWRSVGFGNYNDIILSEEDFGKYNESGQYQYLLFDYKQKKVVDIINIENSSSPFLFYKSRFQNVLLIENYDSSKRYKYIYGEGVSLIDDSEFLSSFMGKYISKSPQNDAYIIKINKHIDEYNLEPGDEGFDLHKYINRNSTEEIILPEAWPVELKANDSLFRSIYVREIYFDSSENKTRAIDWKILNNKYVFMLNSNEFSNPYGDRAYFVVKNLNNKIIFSIPEITAPYSRNERESYNSLHDTFIDFNFDNSKVLIKGIFNNKLRIMIYDIVTHDGWDNNNTQAEYLLLSSDFSSSLEKNEIINNNRYSIKPQTSSLYGIIGQITVLDSFLYESPDENSKVIMQLNDETMDRHKGNDRSFSEPYELLCFEILSRTTEKSIINGVEDYWYNIIFDSAKDWKLPVEYTSSSIDFYNSFSAYKGWVFGSNIKLLDEFIYNIQGES